MKNDPELSQLLLTWQAKPPVDANFRHGVWTRISTEDGGRMCQFLRAGQDWCVASLPKPVYAAALTLAFVLSGAAIAEISAQKVLQQQQAEMAQRYVASIDPVAMADKAMNTRP
jgi:hypothetical protein